MKRLVDLTLEDLAASPVWRYEGGIGADAAVVSVSRRALSQSDDEIFLAATEFDLRDASRHSGFCFPADDTGIDYLQPVIVSPAGHVSFWFDGPVEPDVLASQWRALGKAAGDVFPVSFRCLVPVDGRTVSGRIAGVECSPDLTMPRVAAAILEPARHPVPAAAPPPPPHPEDRAPTARPVRARHSRNGAERTARRRKADLPVEFVQGDLKGTGVIHDLSPRGMFVRSSQSLVAGPTLRLRVNLPEGRTLVLNARVVRGAAPTPAGGPGFALRLTEESEEFEALVSKFRGKRK